MNKKMTTHRKMGKGYEETVQRSNSNINKHVKRYLISLVVRLKPNESNGEISTTRLVKVKKGR